MRPLRLLLWTIAVYSFGAAWFVWGLMILFAFWEFIESDDEYLRRLQVRRRTS